MGKGNKDEVFVSLVASFKFKCKNKELKRQHTMCTCGLCSALCVSVESVKSEGAHVAFTTSGVYALVPLNNFAWSQNCLSTETKP